MNFYGKTALLASVLCAGLLATGTLDVEVRVADNAAAAFDLFGSGDGDEEQETAPEIFWQEGSGQEPIVPKGVPASFADLAERVSPGVVNISTERVMSGRHPLEQFFHGPFGGPFEGFGEQRRRVPSLGTGFVVSSDGYIVTNNHVIENVDSITVKLDDGTELEAELVGRDPKTDIALIRVQPDRELFSLPLGDSESVRPGEWVVAIGNPFGYEHSVTAGIVSAKHRDINHDAFDDFIQTDAAINPGNSGGPLINLAGEVIGINTAINPRANTIGFAVPINMAKAILPQLKARGKVTRGLLGVVIQEITPELAEDFSLEDATGALVSKVMPGGPAEKAGIEGGDVIVEFDGKPVKSFNDLPKIVAETPVDQRVDVVVVRNGKRTTLEPVIAAMEQPEITRVSSTPDPGASAFGMRVQDLTPDLAQQLGATGTRGAVVAGVDPTGPAERAGIRRGDVIVEVDRSEISDTEDLQQQLAQAGDRALLLIRRGDGQRYVSIERDES